MISKQGSEEMGKPGGSWGREGGKEEERGGGEERESWNEEYRLRRGRINLSSKRHFRGDVSNGTDSKIKFLNSTLKTIEGFKTTCLVGDVILRGAALKFIY